MRQITWLHLSDLHYCEPKTGWDAEEILETLIDDLRYMESEYELLPDMVFFTGDLAMGNIKQGSGWNLDDQYRGVNLFLEKIRKAFSEKIPKDRVFLVPGNHDVDRDQVSRSTNLLLESLQEEKEIIDLIQKADLDWQDSFRRMHTYRNFLQNYDYGHLLSDPDRLTYGVICPINEVSVGIGGFNSAWSSCRESAKEKGQLKLAGKWQIQTIKTQLKKADFMVALIHHPPNWFTKEDDKRFLNKLQGTFRFCLHGHEHDQWVVELADGQTTVSAAACYQGSDRINGYNFTRLNFEKETAEIWLREYKDTGKGGWVANILPGGKTDTLGCMRLSQTGWMKEIKGDIAPKKQRDGAPKVFVKEHPAPTAVDHEALLNSYLTRELSECRSLPLQDIDPKVADQVRHQSMDLSKVYVSLVTDSPREKESDVKQSFRVLKTELDGKEEDAHLLSVLEVVAAQRRVVLLGNPGSGKSTFVRYTALCMAGALIESNGDWLQRLQPDWNQDALIPIRIPLREFSAGSHCDGTAAGIMHFLDHRLVERELPGVINVLRYELQQGRVIVLFDGLDEVSDPDCFIKTIQSVQDFVATYDQETGNNLFLVTCRGYAYEDTDNKLLDFKVHRLAPLSKSKVFAFVDNWYDEVSRLNWKSRREALDLANGLKNASLRKDILPLARNPLLLTMMACLHSTRGTLPRDRAKLYKEMVELLAFQWQKGRLGEDTSVDQFLKPDKLENALEEIAFQSHKKRIEDKEQDFIEETELVGIFKKYTGDWGKASEVVRYMKYRAGLLLELKEGQFSFPHLSFQEYLAAAYLVRLKNFPQEMKSLVNDNYRRWREVALWTISILERLKQLSYISMNLINKLCPHDIGEGDLPHKEWRAASLAGEALLEIDPGVIDSDDDYVSIRGRILNWLQRIMTTTTIDPRERCANGNRLGQLGDPRFDPDFRHLPTKDEPLCGFIRIPAGTFTMGEDEKGSYKQHPVTLPEFYMSRYPVTVAQFQTFVDESGYDRYNPKCLKGIANWPVVEVSWHDAVAYCDWLTEVLREDDRTPEPLGTLLREGTAGGPP